MRPGGATDYRRPADHPPAPRADVPDAGDDALAKEVTLLELLDRVLDKGVVLSGDITLSVADVDLVYVGLRVLLSSVDAAARSQAPAPATGAATPEANNRSRPTGGPPA